MRITKQEIETTIELFVNSIYDEGEDSSWLTATLEEWIEAVYRELVNWKTIDGCSYRSKENRFEGKENILKRIKSLVINRLEELQLEGYDVNL